MRGSARILNASVLLSLCAALLSDGLPNNGSSELAPPVQECDFNLTANEVRGSLMSPGFPTGYPENANCRWKVIAAYGNVTLVIKKFDVEWSIDCAYDHLKISLGRQHQLLGKFCGFQSSSSLMEDDTIKTNATEVVLEFVSDSNFNSVGFRIEYFTDVAKNPARGTTCNRVLTSRTGSFSSPGYPNGYSANEHCETIISVSVGEVIVLNFEDIAIEDSKKCDGDYVEVFDGPSTEFPSLGRWCGKANVRGITTSTHSAVIVFHSDDVFQDQGFNASFEALQPGVNVFAEGTCGVNRTKLEGAITSPNWPKKYPADQRCLITLNATESRRIELSFEYFLLEKSPNCNADYLDIFDKDVRENSIDVGWRLIDRLCGDGVPQKTIISTSNEMRLNFFSDGFSEVRGFKILYRIIAPPTVEKITLTPNVEPPPMLPPDDMFRYNFDGQIAEIRQGEEYVLHCMPKNVNAHIIWFKDGAELVTSRSPTGIEFPSEYVLYIRSMSSSTVGRYSCESSLQNKRSRMTAELKLAEKAQQKSCNITVRAIKDVTHISGETPYFTCQGRQRGTRRQALSYNWLRNFKPLPANDARFRTTFGHGFYINEASFTDSGVYTCVVTDESNKCSVSTSAVLKITPRGNTEEVCGLPKFTSHFRKEHSDDGKIIAGSTARIGTHPWMAMLFSPKKKAFCGGALLNQQWVLTAAHCLVNFDESISNVSVILGKHDQTMAEDNEFVNSIDKFFVHPNFDPSTYDSDLALIRLRSDVQYTNFIMPICLGETEFVRKVFFNYTDLRYGTVAGWGKLSERGGRPRYLQEIKLPLVSPEKCRASTSHPVTPNMFCAGYNQDIIGDACKGDSGGSFTVEHNGRWFAIGVVSWGVGCGRAGHYGFYIKLDNYHTWIKQRIS